MINTAWLRTFCILAETGHFTRTAENLNMTQSGVSQHIKRLEEYLGASVLERTGKQFTLSETGRKLYTEAKDVIESLSTMPDRVTADPAYDGTVSIMSPGSVGLKLYPHLLKFQQRHPKLKIAYRFAPNKEIVNCLTRSLADIGLTTDKPVEHEILAETVGDEKLLVVTPINITQPDWKILQELGFINHPDGKYHANLLLSANFQEYATNPVVKETGFCNQIGLIPEPVSLGLGFTVLPQYAVESFDKPHLIRVHELPIPVCERLYLCRKRQRFTPKRVEIIMEEIKSRLN
ncbi:LysR family transcriptional regulator [Alteromonas sp. ASW11-130]|uniref:LysR family transcriptional regulator n=1 Tax=Alteromonas sp. ASW11-130 TaxID=3015775 RepID=UPI002242B198|nr:LysR family transcriptional regulator [Alteromonas sp. ASW11-130]MCW8091485.1 LysR family transcriptional regulator [Alteromonas sp. ASW11-130]